MKNTPNDGYENWFLANHKLNSEKGSVARWKKHQPILHPTSKDFEQRVVYQNGTYLFSPDDLEAKNLVKYLKLDDSLFVRERKLYIENQRKSINKDGVHPADYFQNLLRDDPERGKHIRAIETEFRIKLNFKTH